MLYNMPSYFISENKKGESAKLAGKKEFRLSSRMQVVNILQDLSCLGAFAQVMGISVDLN